MTYMIWRNKLTYNVHNTASCATTSATPAAILNFDTEFRNIKSD